MTEFLEDFNANNEEVEVIININIIILNTYLTLYQIPEEVFFDVDDDYFVEELEVAQ